MNKETPIIAFTVCMGIILLCQLIAAWAGMCERLGLFYGSGITFLIMLATIMSFFKFIED